jgi:hypothetical protein
MRNDIDTRGFGWTLGSRLYYSMLDGIDIPPSFSLAWSMLSSILSMNADSVDRCNTGGCTQERDKI